MTDQSIFDNNVKQPETPSENVTSSNDPYAHLLGVIKNESGQQKYSSVEKALEALAHSQGYIPELKTKVTAQDEIIRTLQEELAKQKTVADYLDKFNDQKGSMPATQPAAPVSPSLDPKAIADIVRQTVEAKEQEKVFSENVNKAQSALVKHFGDKVGEVLETKARELGISKTEIGQLAGKSPAAVLAMFGLSSQQGGFNFTTGSISIPPSAPQKDEPLAPPKKSLLRGATAKEQAEYMREIKKNVYKQYNIEYKD